MQELNEALKRYEWQKPETIRPSKRALLWHEESGIRMLCRGENGGCQTEKFTQEVISIGRKTHKPGYRLGFDRNGDWLEVPEIKGWLPLPSFDRPDPRNEALRVAWEALAFYAQPTETIEGDDPDEPDWPIVVHQWPGNDDGEKAREALGAILKALEGGE